MKSCFFFLLCLISSCAYVGQMHRQIDREEAKIAGQDSEYLDDPYAAHREQGFKRRRADRKPIANPHSLSNLNPTKHYTRPEDREYSQPGRTNARDFTDQGSNGSLWVNAPGGSLFTTDIHKKLGDIVIINVLDNLRNQISSELKRTFPEQRKKKKDDGKKAAGDKAPASAATADAAQPEKDELETKVYDKISGIVAEEVNRDYFLLRGKKQVIFRKEKRFIEVQALVSRKDIADNDFINSDKLLESRVLIMR